MNTYPDNITALYARLSQEDALDGESNSIANQDRAKGLAACGWQTASPFGCLNGFNFSFEPLQKNSGMLCSVMYGGAENNAQMM